MELIREITDKDISGKEIIWEEDKYRFRKSARAIITDDKGNIALIEADEDKYCKLPGGSILENESLENAIKRVSKEETGCNIKIQKELGIIIEHKNKYGQIQISYCFICKLDGQKEENFTQKKKDETFHVNWVSVNEALKKFKNSTPKAYTHQFVNERDLSFVLKFKDSVLR